MVFHPTIANHTMPTNCRLLVFALLLLGPLVAMADEFPKDTNTITSLTAEEAKRLVAGFKGKYQLGLGGLTTLDADVAKALAEYKGDSLFLNGVLTLDTDTAKALAGYKAAQTVGGLSLNGLTTIAPDTAKALADIKVGVLYLNGLITLDAETSKALAAFKGTLSLTGLQTASFGAVRALRQNPHVFIPNHWYLLRYDIAALVGTVVFVVILGIVVWYSCRQRAAGPSNSQAQVRRHRPRDRECRQAVRCRD